MSSEHEDRELGTGEVYVHVTDNGPGISAATRETLFQPFATTKQRGTGLGLAASRRLARDNGGDLEVHSHASRIALHLDTPGDQRCAQRFASIGDHMTHRILLVEDEPNYRKVLAMMLADFDVTLIEATDGVHALELLGTEDVDLVVTDRNMPRMGGLELLAQIKSQRRRPPVVVMTAYSSIENAVEAMQAGAIDYLSN